MSSVLEVISGEVVVQEANDNGGLNVLLDNDNAFVSFEEKDGAESAKDPGDDIVISGRGFDFISGGKGDDVIVGGDGADILDGGAGSDIIRGGTGDDIIIGGKDSDIMMGGSGADIFKLQLEDFANSEDSVTATDRIMDFEVGVDTVQINGVDTDKINLDGNEVKYNGETIIRLGGDVTGIQGEAVDDDTFELF